MEIEDYNMVQYNDTMEELNMNNSLQGSKSIYTNETELINNLKNKLEENKKLKLENQSLKKKIKSLVNRRQDIILLLNNEIDAIEDDINIFKNSLDSFTLVKQQIKIECYKQILEEVVKINNE